MIILIDNSEYINGITCYEITCYLAGKGIQTIILNGDIEAIKEKYIEGYTVICLVYTDNLLNTKKELKGFPLVTVGSSEIPGMYNLTAKSIEDIIAYIEPYYFSFESLISDFGKAAFKAGNTILDIYNKDFSVSYKEDESPVTEADRMSNDIIVSELSLRYPDYAVLAEESYNEKNIEKRLNNPFCFIIDPLDGTKEFIKKNGEFTVNIALSYKNRSVAGMIYLPVFNILYYAACGRGAYCVSKDAFTQTMIFDKNNRIFVSDRTDSLIVMHSKSSFDRATKELLHRNKTKIGKLISKGSAIKMCKIAEGYSDVYYRYGHTMEWDTAAGQIIIEEAGGIMRQLDDNESQLTYNRIDSCNRNGFYVINSFENRFTFE